MDRKGAIQVSIGFLIVMVISALVMIFMMSWIGGMFPQLTKISTFATTQAEQQMMNEFSKGDNVLLATVPYKEQFQPGSEVWFKIGVKKTGVDDADNFFSLCVGKMSGATCVTPSEENPSAVCSGNDDECKITFKFSPLTKIINRNGIETMAAVMQIPADGVDKGIYGYRIYVCASDKATDTCDGLQESVGQYDFLVQVS